MVVRRFIRRRRILSAVGLLGASLLMPAAAKAHAIIVSSVPAANAQIRQGPCDVLLQYNSRIDLELSRVTLEDPTGATSVLDIEAGDKPGTLVSHVAVGLAGHWLLRWQVLSIDGHVTRGEIPFTVEAKTPP